MLAAFRGQRVQVSAIVAQPSFDFAVPLAEKAPVVPFAVMLAAARTQPVIPLKLGHAELAAVRRIFGVSSNSHCPNCVYH